MTNFSLGKNKTIKAKALFIAEHIDLRTLEITGKVAYNPLLIQLGMNGACVLFRFGTLVFFNTEEKDELKCLNGLKPLLKQAFETPKTEEIEISLAEDAEGMYGNELHLKNFSIERLQLVADILAKTVVLDYYESNVAATFDSIEPIATSLQDTGTCGHEAKDLLKHIGGSLLSMHKMIGRVQINEKPDTLWNHPHLEGLYYRLQDEYELMERHIAMEQKLALISRTAQTVLDLLEHKHSSRLEWYIIILILVAIVISLYELFVEPFIHKILLN